MLKLVPLSQIPAKGGARDRERTARKAYGNKAAALQGAQFEIVQAEGTYSGAFAPTVGWCCSRVAAEALAAELTYMPGNTCHHSLSFVFHG